jgi:hypothetical protein
MLRNRKGGDIVARLGKIIAKDLVEKSKAEKELALKKAKEKVLQEGAKEAGKETK